MQTNLHRPKAFTALIVACFAFLNCAFAAMQTPQGLAQNFANPPDGARPWVYWFWSDGNVTQAGITADLEAMQRVGIGGVLIMEVDQGVPKGPVRIMTPQWKAMVAFAENEAKRLGIKMVMNNDAGWSGSGGPWNTPENSMQKVVWTERSVSGPSKFDGTLAQPKAVKGFYRDIAVLAFPTPKAESPVQQASVPKISTNAPGDFSALIDGDSKTGISLTLPENPADFPYVQFEYSDPIEAGAFQVLASFAKQRQGEAEKSLLCTFKVSDDGHVFREVARAPANDQIKTFTPVTARFFRLVFSGNDSSLHGGRVNEIILSAAQRIDHYEAKSGLGLASSPEISAPSALEKCVSKDRILDLTSQFCEGRLRWDVPAGDWTILRIGHTSTGRMNAPAPQEARGLEVDKLNPAALDKHIEGFIGKILGDAEKPAGRADAFSGIHIDSWEVGYQNWTPRFREEFRRLRGYDPLPWLVVFTGRPVGNVELSERFLWDVRRTISDLLNENYADRMAELAHKRGVNLSIEGYHNGPFDPLSYAGRADIPMGEFWVPPGPLDLNLNVKAMASAGHIYGKNMIAAEAFTSFDMQSRHQLHPYAVKAIGDAAFCEGVNLFVFHRYAMQPWTDDRVPGMTMGPWGWEYERTATWWESSRPWHEYLARCQYLLRQGNFVADICYLQDEEGIKNPPLSGEVKPEPPPGYDYDLCTAEIVRDQMRVKDGCFVLPDGMRYRLLVMPQQRLMTPELLQKISELVREGGVLLGDPPLRAPGLSHFPECDAEVQKISESLWGNCDGVNVKEHRFGKGRVFRGISPAEALAAIGAPPDFVWAKNDPNTFIPSGGKAYAVSYIHRTMPDWEIYFVANLTEETADISAAFRVSDSSPQLWHPETGKITFPAIYETEKANGVSRIRLPLALGPRESVFVLFPKGTIRPHLVENSDSPLVIAPRTAQSPVPSGISGNFTLAAWVKPDADTALPTEAFEGSNAARVMRNDLLYPPQGALTFRDSSASGVGICVGRNGICVVENGASHFPATLVHTVSIVDWTHVAVVFRDGRPQLYINGQSVRFGLRSSRNVRGYIPPSLDPAATQFVGEHSTLQLFDHALDTQEIRELARTAPTAEIRSTPDTTAIAPEPQNNHSPVHCDEITLGADNEPILWTPHAGRREFTQSDGRTLMLEAASIPGNITLDGSWTVKFPKGRGAPALATLPQLMLWNENAIPGVRYFSGTATYQKNFKIPDYAYRADRRLWLDLGTVHEIARVRLNGHDLGILWKPPFRVDITDAIRDGMNELEIDVTNTWVNRLIGDEQLKEDAEWVRVPRRHGFVLKAYPDWFLRGERSPSGRITFSTWKHYGKESPLTPSGLLGPVVIQTLVKATTKEQPDEPLDPNIPEAKTGNR